ncbi:multiprotein-bridging factor 1 family protein [Streptomyces sp. NPDC051018]|uniref:multiprotein-bridging factor 1 family protein n=1 Tax=Streptomyces sp. NPDC051018 TaxID=3365639 RepID=UPI00379802A1
MERPAGNTRLTSARVAAGYRSQRAFAAALGVGVRQVRRWESAEPPWPRADQRRAIVRALGRDLESLGFSRPDGPDGGDSPDGHGPGAVRRDGASAELPESDGIGTRADRITAPAASAPVEDFRAATRSLRGRYGTVAPAVLHPATLAHAATGRELLRRTAGRDRLQAAGALAETLLLCGRIEFSTLRMPERAGRSWLRAHEVAREAGDPLLASAALAHAALVPGRNGHLDEASAEHLSDARAEAGRTRSASAEFLAWLDVVEAEREVRRGDTGAALRLIGHAEDVLSLGGERDGPEWFDWFGPGRLAAFKGGTLLGAGRLDRARETLLRSLPLLSSAGYGDRDGNGIGDGGGAVHAEDQVRTAVYGDLAEVEAAAGDPEAACGYACRAVGLLDVTSRAMDPERVREVREALMPHLHRECLRDLEEQLYGVPAAVGAFADRRV